MGNRRCADNHHLRFDCRRGAWDNQRKAAADSFPAGCSGRDGLAGLRQRRNAHLSPRRILECCAVQAGVTSGERMSWAILRQRASRLSFHTSPFLSGCAILACCAAQNSGRKTDTKKDCSQGGLAGCRLVVCMLLHSRVNPATTKHRRQHTWPRGFR